MRDKKIRVFLRITVILMACAFIAYGIYRGEVDVVFTKAINICFECIGIG